MSSTQILSSTCKVPANRLDILVNVWVMVMPQSDSLARIASNMAVISIVEAPDVPLPILPEVASKSLNSSSPIDNDAISPCCSCTAAVRIDSNPDGLYQKYPSPPSFTNSGMTSIISWATKPYIRLSVEPPYNCWWVSFHLNLMGLNCIRVSKAVPLTSPWTFFRRMSERSDHVVPPTVLPAEPVTWNVLELGLVVPMPTLPAP